MTTPQIISIGLDGPNRVGKGTQCAYLQKWLDARRIPSLIVRGAGSRTGLGNQPGDPMSPWWQEVNQWLRLPEATFQDWDITSARLARELIVWRDRILPNHAKRCENPVAVLIVDRTLLSRTMTLRARRSGNIINNLYPTEAFGRNRTVSPDQVCPDVIINLTAPRRRLLNRLSKSDPKYHFRKRLIESTADWFIDAAQYIPVELQNRVVEIDGARPAEVVFETICRELLRRYPHLMGQVEAGRG